MKTERRCLATALLAFFLIGGAGTSLGAEFYGVRPLFPIWGHLYNGLFKSPSAIFVDRVSGEIYVADTGNNMVGIFDKEGRWLFSFGNNGELTEPRSVAVDGEGQIIVSDLEGVKLFDYRGQFLGLFPFQGLDKAIRLAALGLDKEGDIYFLDKENARVAIYSRDRQLKGQFKLKGKEPAKVYAPSGIAVDGKGRIFVTDAQNTPVQVYDSSGKFLFGWGERNSGPDGFSLPGGISVDEEGRVYIADTLRQDIKVFDAKGTFLQRFGGLGRGPGDVAYPAGVVAGTNGWVYVVEKVGQRVQVFERLTTTVQTQRQKEQTREEVRKTVQQMGIKR